MTTQPAYFSLSFGLAGLYMPDSHFGSYEVTTRRELMSILRSALAFYDMPKSALRQVKARSLWGHMKKHGASVLHFDIDHGGHALHFGGMTEAEYQADQQAGEE